MGAGHAHALYVHEHSPLHRLAPQIKITATVAFVAAVAVTPRQAVWAFAVHALVMVAVTRISRIGFGFLGLRMLGVLPFIAFAFLLPFVGSGEEVEVVGVALSRDGLWSAWNILAKASIGAAASIVLAGTTEVPDLLAGLTRLRVPVLFTAIAGFMIRYLEVIVGEIGRIRIAMTARGYDPRWLWQARPIAASAGTVFVRSYERGERVYDAMQARGFTGEMPDLRRHDPARSQWLAASVIPVVAVLTTTAAWWTA